MASFNTALLLLAAASLSAVDAWNCACGFYCPDPVKKFRAPLVCPAGSFCKRSGYNATSFPTPCPAGSFCPKGSCAPSDCPCGYKCPPKSPDMIQCQPPFYCPGTKNSAQTLCPIGAKCDEPGMCEIKKCPPGTFVSCAGKKTCDLCPKGRFCATPTSSVLCPAGFFCPEGSSAPTPCPADKSCPLGSHKAC
jgi:hypothetical protein